MTLAGFFVLWGFAWFSLQFTPRRRARWVFRFENLGRFMRPIAVTIRDDLRAVGRNIRAQFTFRRERHSTDWDDISLEDL